MTSLYLVLMSYLFIILQFAEANQLGAGMHVHAAAVRARPSPPGVPTASADAASADAEATQKSEEAPSRQEVDDQLSKHAKKKK